MSEVSEKKKWTLGIWVTEKKFGKMDLGRLKELCEKEGISVKELDLNVDLEPQGPFHVILHRVSDLVSQRKDGDRVAAALLWKLRQYLHRHPQTLLLDPLSTVRKLSDRFKVCKLIQEKIAFEDVQVPLFLRIRYPRNAAHVEIVNKARKCGLTYPILGKSVLAHNHEQVIIFNEEGLSAVHKLRPPVLLQNYIPHNGVLYKINVIGQNIHILTRPSIRNLKGDIYKPPEYFHTHNITKPPSQNYHLSLNPPSPTFKKTNATPHHYKISRLVRRIREEVNLTVFSMDVILETITNRHYIIDINYFPAFEGVPNVPEKLMKNVKGKVQELGNQKPPQSQHSLTSSTGSDEEKNRQ